MYFITSEIRLQEVVMKAINEYLGDKGKAHIDSGKLMVDISKGFEEVVEHVEPRKHNGVLICGGGIQQPLNGLKFEIKIKQEGEKE